MKYKGKDLVLLVWDGDLGKHRKYILNPALRQNSKDEYHVLAGMKIGEL